MYLKLMHFVSKDRDRDGQWRANAAQAIAAFGETARADRPKPTADRRDA